MADMTPLIDILNGNPGTAIPVEGNFQTIEDYINGTDLVRTDGTEVMAANLPMGGFKVTGLGTGTAGTDGVNVTQLAARTPYLVYHGTGTQAYTSGQTANFTIDVEVFDSGTVGAVGSAVLTIPSTGLYVLVIQASTSTGVSNIEPTSSTAGNLVQRTVNTTTANASNTVFLTSGGTITLTAANQGGDATLTFDVKLYRIA